MRLAVTIHEASFDAALRAIRDLPADPDLVELRAEDLGPIDLRALRAATDKPLILTHRGRQTDDGTIISAIEAGIDLIDVEWHEDLEIRAPRSKIILSHHDYDGMPEVETLLEEMLARGCGHTKLAVSPKTMEDNQRLIRLADAHRSGGPAVTIIGMGERGLYTRILAPFRGSALAFAAAGAAAAPGQLTLARALEIYGSERETLRAAHIFAVAGNPAGHSLSPSIHNRLFREKGVPAAYTIASFETFEEIVAAKEIRGLSVTAPFKEAAYAYARRHGIPIAPNAEAAGSVNTLTGRIADNTDVDGFEALIGKPRRAAIAGAGGTARAALVALQRAGAEVRVFNRTPRPFPVAVEPLDALDPSGGYDVIINTTPIPIDGPHVIDTRYSDAAGSGYELLRAQALRQNALFVEAIG
jgi:3-dehydroquinate dehydratase type I